MTAVSSNEELSREGLRRWSEGDLEGTFATMDPGIEWHLAFELPDLPAGKLVYTGFDEVRQVWDAFRSVWDTITVEIEEVLHDEDGMLVARANFAGKASGSGIELERTVYYVLDISEARLLTRIRPFDSLDQAWEAAGLDG
jgi:ketosteroid isomerase-like protein